LGAMPLLLASTTLPSISEAALDDLINGQLHEGLELEKTCKPLRKELRRLLVFGSGYSHTIKGPQV
jgi:hypothetical protein